MLIQFGMNAQNHQTTVKIKSKTEYKADFKDGNGKAIINEKMEYDSKGNLTREVSYGNDGIIKKDIRYIYNDKNQVTSEEYYKSNGKLDKKYVYTYNDKGLKTAKSEYDANNKLNEQKTYTYEYF